MSDSRKPKALYLEWIDSCSVSGWRHEDHDGTSRIRTLGLFVRETPKYVTLTTSTSEHGNHVDMISIPKSCIVRRKRVEI